MSDVVVRGLPPQLHRALKQAATRNRRSVNGEIVARLEASFGSTVLDTNVMADAEDVLRDRVVGVDGDAPDVATRLSAS